MSKTYADFLDNVMPDVPGCTKSMAENAIKNTIIHFCEKSLILQRNHDPLTCIEGISEYDFEPPSGQLVIKIMKMWVKGSELIALAPDDIGVAEIYNTAFSGANTSKSDPVYYLQKEERIVSVYPIPSTTVASGFTIRVAYKPSRSATTVDDVLFEDYADIIGDGAKYRLFLSPGKPYSSLDAATTHKGLYTEGLNVAIQRASRGHVRSDLSVQLRSA